MVFLLWCCRSVTTLSWADGTLGRAYETIKQGPPRPVLVGIWHWDLTLQIDPNCVHANVSAQRLASIVITVQYCTVQYDVLRRRWNFLEAPRKAQRGSERIPVCGGAAARISHVDSKNSSILNCKQHPLYKPNVLYWTLIGPCFIHTVMSCLYCTVGQVWICCCCGAWTLRHHTTNCTGLIGVWSRWWL